MHLAGKVASNNDRLRRTFLVDPDGIVANITLEPHLPHIGHSAVALASAALKIAENYKTVFMLNTFGSPVTTTLIRERQKQYPSWYTNKRVAGLYSVVGTNYFGFDDTGVVTGILWGWRGESGYVNGWRFGQFAGQGDPRHDRGADGGIAGSVVGVLDVGAWGDSFEERACGSVCGGRGGSGGDDGVDKQCCADSGVEFEGGAWSALAEVGEA
ncbi:hypothetical protein BLNAU_4121 [Blattamonas nauphoetae]|uniref:Uncharacterized protein n=1 Tax=Blattamonas nauphoetae TaxID=2049346 RepID=A0ABQ9YBD1_9EUKA|nr:hypothetical protein BLNAU_4121 [Blattamonas nauphoetae]